MFPSSTCFLFVCVVMKNGLVPRQEIAVYVGQGVNLVLGKRPYNSWKLLQIFVYWNNGNCLSLDKSFCLSELQ